ncbi:MAG: hypothetical protein JXC85_02795 [Candidatus Aenigmarchaeota archaeon]|nr:hypothetical protein [Candidatus Aenigmarchaeota archaeon]
MEEGLMRKARKYEKDLDMLMSLVKGSDEMDLSSREKGSMLYALEAEEIDLKNLGGNA